MGRLHRCVGTLNSDGYIELLEEHYEASLEKMGGIDRPIFQQDSAPCHTSKKVMAYFEEKGINVMSWPAQSPDLNPIENLWAIMKAKLRKVDCTSKAKLHEAIANLWENDSDIVNSCQKLVGSMPARIQQVIKNRGGHIRY